MSSSVALFVSSLLKYYCTSCIIPAGGCLGLREKPLLELADSRKRKREGKRECNDREERKEQKAVRGRKQEN